MTGPAMPEIGLGAGTVQGLVAIGLLLVLIQPALWARAIRLFRRDRRQTKAASRGMMPPLSPERRAWPALIAVFLALTVMATMIAPTLQGALLLASVGLVLTALAALDWRSLWLPLTLTLPITLAGLMASGSLGLSLMESLGGAALGYGLLWGVGFLVGRAKGTVALGGGDPVLSAAIGAWVGPLDLMFALAGASLLGLGFVGALRIAGSRAPRRLPFGAFLALSLLGIVAIRIANAPLGPTF